MELRIPRDGEPCKHPGCLSHLTHPCEVCGRIGGKGDDIFELPFRDFIGRGFIYSR